MAKYKVTPRQVQPQKPKRSLGSIVARALPGVAGLGLIALGLVVIVSVHAGGHRDGSRAGLLLIVIGIVVLMAWAFSNKSDGYNF